MIRAFQAFSSKTPPTLLSIIALTNRRLLRSCPPDEPHTPRCRASPPISLSACCIHLSWCGVRPARVRPAPATRGDGPAGPVRAIRGTGGEW